MLEKRRYGLIGYPISHSFSPGYFARKFELEAIRDAQYDLYPLKSIDQFSDLKGLHGVNVTIPYKEAVIPLLDVYTVKFVGTKKVGYNTDVYGFEHSLVSLWQDNPPTRALVLGTGGAAKAVWYVLDRLSIDYHTVSRSTHANLTYGDIDERCIMDHQLIINTTPLGMSPNIHAAPELPYDSISEDHILYDLVYNPEITLFMQNGLDRGAIVKNGLEMLELQADRAWDIWTTT